MARWCTDTPALQWLLSACLYASRTTDIGKADWSVKRPLQARSSRSRGHPSTVAFSMDRQFAATWQAASTPTKATPVRQLRAAGPGPHPLASAELPN